MYSYVEPISITPFTSKAINRYLGLYLATVIRHRTRFVERNSASNISVMSDTQLNEIADELTTYFHKRKLHLHEFDSLIQNLLNEGNINHIQNGYMKHFTNGRLKATKH